MDSPLRRLSEKGKYSGMIKLPSQTDTKYQDIQEWWKTHKNTLKREKNDMACLSFEGYPSLWDMLTTAITKAEADEQKLLRAQMIYLKNGQCTGNMFGY